MARHACAKRVLALKEEGMSVREIAKSRHISHHTIKEVFDRAQQAGVGWDDIRLLSAQEVVERLFPEEYETKDALDEPDFDEVHAELAKVGVTLKLLWEEYADSCRAQDKAYISYTTFTRRYRDYVVAKNVTNHLDHKPAEVMEVDWSGSTMQLTDPVTLKTTKAYLFVAVLPYSQYTYVEATLDMKQNTWLLCHVHAYEFFGGATLRLICDNLKTGVIAHPKPKDGEIILNEAYEALAEHYMCAIMPTDVHKPKQKPSVEGGVGKIATAVIARLRNETFASLSELNYAIRTCVDAYNATPFQKREASRAEVFEAQEKPLLTALPQVPYEIAEWVYARKVALDFHVAYKTNRYSVPYTFVGSKVDLKVSSDSIEIYSKGTRIATHPKFADNIRYCYHTNPSHMPPEFTRPAWDKERMQRWAHTIGPNTQAVVGRVFDGSRYKGAGL